MADWNAVNNSLNQGFARGQAAGGRLSGLGMALGKIADSIKTVNDENRAMGQKRDILGMEEASKLRLAQAEPDYEINKAIAEKIRSGEGDSDLMTRGLLSKKTGVPFEMMMTPEEQSQKNAVKVEEVQSQELAKGSPASESGKVALANESIKNIGDIKRILFPTGKANSFKRTTAFASNLPGGSWPMLPSRGWGKAEQDVFRKMGASLAGRQLIQTGVAARPEETQKLISEFAPSLGSNPEAALAGLNELEVFYKDYLNTLKTRGTSNTEPSQNNVAATGLSNLKSKWGLD